MAGIALGVSAAALWALDVRVLGYAEPQRPEIAPQTVARTEAGPELRLEAERGADMAYRLDLGVKRPTPVPETTTEVIREPDPPPPDPMPQTGPVLVYVGPIYEATRTLAVVSVDGKQRIVPEGRSMSGVKLVTVRDNEIVVQDDSGQRSVSRGERMGPAVSWVRNMPANTAVASNMAAQAAARRAVVAARQGQATNNMELEQRFRERGIDPAQAQRWREMMRERQAQRGEMTHIELGEMIEGIDELSDEELLRRQMELGIDGEEFDDDYLRKLSGLEELEEDQLIELRRRMEEERMRRLKEQGVLSEDTEVRVP
jgi:hypothetical protein